MVWGGRVRTGKNVPKRKKGEKWRPEGKMQRRRTRRRRRRKKRKRRKRRRRRRWWWVTS